MIIITKKIDGKLTSFLLIYFRNAIKMGIKQSKFDHKPEQYPDQGMREMGFCLGKIHLGGPFFIKAQENQEQGIYTYFLYHHDGKVYTEFFSFENTHLSTSIFKIEYDGSIVKFIFQTDSFEKDQKFIIEYSFDFSKSFDCEKDFVGSLKSMPFEIPCDRKIIHLSGSFYYYIIRVWSNYYNFYIVESMSEDNRGFQSTFKNSDTIISKINIETSSIPFVKETENGGLIIMSDDEGFVPIQINLPNDVMSLSQLLVSESTKFSQ